jgi:hypothetical protein
MPTGSSWEKWLEKGERAIILRFAAAGRELVKWPNTGYGARGIKQVNLTKINTTADDTFFPQFLHVEIEGNLLGALLTNWDLEGRPE